QWTWRRQVLHDPGHRLEEAHVVLGRGRLALRRAELGKQASELRSPRRLQLFDQSGNDLSSTEGIHQWAERQDLLTLVRPAEQDLASGVDRLGDERFDASRLPDSGLALNHSDRAVTLPGVIEPFTKGRQLDGPPDKRRGRGDEVPRAPKQFSRRYH